MNRSGNLTATQAASEDFPEALSVLHEGVAQGVAPGFVLGVWKASQPDSAKLLAVGQRRSLGASQPMELDTLFDLASVSKVMATASLAAVLVERGWVSWNTRVKAVLPEVASAEITLEQLLSHTAGFPAWRPLWEGLRADFGTADSDRIWSFPVKDRQAAMRRRVLEIPPDAAPGERTLYSDVCFLLAGFLLEEVTRMPLDRAVEELVWRPMGLTGARYRRVTRPVKQDVLPEAAATEDCPWRGGVLQGQVHDDNTWAMGGYAGHAGAFGRAVDVLAFAASWIDGFLTPATRGHAWRRVSRPTGCERTPGWDTPSAQGSSTGSLFSGASVGHLGFTGTSLWIDPPAGLAVTLLSNRVHPSRENTRIREFRPRLHDAVRRDLNRK